MHFGLIFGEVMMRLCMHPITAVSQDVCRSNHGIVWNCGQSPARKNLGIAKYSILNISVASFSNVTGNLTQPSSIMVAFAELLISPPLLTQSAHVFIFNFKVCNGDRKSVV